MKKIAVVLDSTALESPRLKNNPDVYVAPLEVIVDGKTYEDRKDIKEADWISFLKKDATMTTSQPSLKNTIDILKEVQSKEYDHVFVLSIASNLSGTFNGFELANNELQLENIDLIDTYTIAGPVTIMAENIFKYNEEGKSIEEIRDMLNKMIDLNVTYVYPATLKRLIFSGRMNKTVGSLANLLKLKVLLVLKNKGEQIEKHDVYRTEKKLFAQLVEEFKKMGVNEKDWVFYVMDIENEAGIQQLKSILQKEFGQVEIRQEMLPGVIATHVGIGVLGVQVVKRNV